MNNSIRNTLYFILIISGINSIIWWGAYHYFQFSLEEHGIIELAQAAEIALAGLLFFKAALSKKSIHKIFHFNLTLLCLAFFFREVTLSDFSTHPFAIWFSEDIGLMLLMSISWSAFTIYYIFNFKNFVNTLKKWLCSAPGITIICCGCSLLISFPFDKEMFNMPQLTSKFFEELSEINAFLLLIYSAVLCLRKEPSTS